MCDDGDDDDGDDGDDDDDGLLVSLSDRKGGTVLLSLKHDTSSINHFFKFYDCHIDVILDPHPTPQPPNPQEHILLILTYPQDYEQPI